MARTRVLSQLPAPSTAGGRTGGWPLVTILSLVLAAAPLQAQEPDTAPGDSSSAGPGLRTALLLTGAYVVAGSVVMEQVWYRDRERVAFHFYDDNGAYLQVDKLGHAFGAYVQSYIGYHWLRRSGRSRAKSLLYGGALGLVLQTPIEIMDGIHEGWGFSWGDVAANALGSGLVVGQELRFGEQWVKYRFSYRESRYARMANGYLGATTLERLLEDYNGHTYWLSIPLAKLVAHDGIPGWLNVAVGYGANGMFGEFDNITEYGGVTIPPTDRYRQFLLSLDVDWTRVRTGSPVLRTLFTGLTFVKTPFPALELTSRRQLRAHWLFY